MSKLANRLLAVNALRMVKAPTIDPRQNGSNTEESMTPEALARFATLVTEARKKAETRTAFARALGITRSTLRAWEGGAQEPTEKHLTRLAEVLGVPVSTIRGEAPVLPDDTRLRELVDDDIEVAYRYHHASAQAKLGTYELHTAPLSNATRERIGHLISLCVRHQDRLLGILEPIASTFDAPHRAVPRKLVAPHATVSHTKKR